MKSEKVNLVCEYCGEPFLVISSQGERRKHCSDKCRRLSTRKFEVTAAELEKLVWEMPTVKVAKLFGVSDKAIAKKCEALGVQKPPRGYWAKVEHGQLTPQDEVFYRRFRDKHKPNG